MALFVLIEIVYSIVLFVAIFGTYLNFNVKNDIPDCYSDALGRNCIAGSSGCINVTLRWHRLCALGLTWSLLLWIVLISCCTYLRADRGGKIAIISSIVVVILSLSWAITTMIFLFDVPGLTCSTDKVAHERFFLAIIAFEVLVFYTIIILRLMWI